MLALTHDGMPAGAPEEDMMIDVSNIEGQMRASSVRRVAQMVEQHPEQCLAILRGWLQQEQG